MSDTQINTQDGRPAAQPSTTTQSHREDDNDARGRRWNHPRPEPRCRADVMGFNYTLWLFCALVLLILVLPW